MSEPRRFKLVEDPEGDLTEDYLRPMIHHDAIPEPEPTYPEWSDEWCERVDAATCPWQPEGYVADGRTHLKRFHDAGLLVVERDEWERLRGTEAPPARYDQCDETCTVDCGHCKGEGPPRLTPEEQAVLDAAEAWVDACPPNSQLDGPNADLAYAVWAHRATKTQEGEG